MNGQTTPTAGATQPIVVALIDRLRRTRAEITDVTMLLDNQADRLFGPVPTDADVSSGKPQDNGYLLRDLSDAVDQLDRAVRANRDAAVRLQPLA